MEATPQPLGFGSGAWISCGRPFIEVSRTKNVSRSGVLLNGVPTKLAVTEIQGWEDDLGRGCWVGGQRGSCAKAGAKPRDRSSVLAGLGTKPYADHATVRKQHVQALKTCGVRSFVLYSLRHTFLRRLGAYGCDVWTLARIAGHSSIQMSAKYVHPDEKAVLNAMAKIPEARELTQ